MNTWENLNEHLSEIEGKLNYEFQNKELLRLSFVHRSFVNENKNVQGHNERLEFLGDAVLNLIVAEYLYKQMPDTPEGELSYIRSRLVEASTCVLYLQKLGVGDKILLGKGERMNEGRGRESILADLFEGIIGAIYLDGGLLQAQNFFLQAFKDEIEQIIKTPIRNFKAILQDISQKKYKQAPHYEVLKEAGPDHSKNFIVAVSILGEVYGKGEGSSKKEAQQNAAENALLKLEENLGR
jgi:ribonuclease-3